ncbi:hypothetical protein ABIF69_000615 [Bradyrhizobium japonicum]
MQGDARGCELAYKMVAERDNEKCSFARESRLLIVAKAKVWASEGWQVVITDRTARPTLRPNSISYWRRDRATGPMTRFLYANRNPLRSKTL